MLNRKRYDKANVQFSLPYSHTVLYFLVRSICYYYFGLYCLITSRPRVVNRELLEILKWNYLQAVFLSRHERT